MILKHNLLNKSSSLLQEVIKHYSNEICSPFHSGNQGMFELWLAENGAKVVKWDQTEIVVDFSSIDGMEWLTVLKLQGVGCSNR